MVVTACRPSSDQRSYSTFILIRRIYWAVSCCVTGGTEKHAESRPLNLIFVDGRRENPSHAVWIPDDSVDIQLRLRFIVQTGPTGHRGLKSAEHLL